MNEPSVLEPLKVFCTYVCCDLTSSAERKTMVTTFLQSFQEKENTVSLLSY